MRRRDEPSGYTYNFYQTMKLSFEQMCQGERPWTALGNFMNHWYSSHMDERERLIADPLPENYPPDFHQWAVFCAASVEWFSRAYGVPCPDWVNDPRYILDKPWFFERGGHEKLLQTTPPEFVRRNVFCGADIYANKWEFIADLWARYSEKLAAKVGQPSDDILPYIEVAKKKQQQLEQQR